MRGKKTLTGRTQFELVYKKGRSWASSEIVIKVLPNGLDSSRYGLTVSRRVGKAVVRNRIKRRLREILKLVNMPPGWDLVVIARNPAASADFNTLRRVIRDILFKAGLLVGENEKISPGTY